MRACCCPRSRRGVLRGEDRRRAARVLAHPGVVEDATDIILNLKQIRSGARGSHQDGVLRVDKPGDVKARDIEADADIEILEPDAHIATVSEGGRFTWRCASSGAGLRHRDRNFDEDLGIGWIPIDSVHSPVKKVNYLVEAARLGRRPTTRS